MFSLEQYLKPYQKLIKKLGLKPYPIIFTGLLRLCKVTFYVIDIRLLTCIELHTEHKPSTWLVTMLVPFEDDTVKIRYTILSAEKPYCNYMLVPVTLPISRFYRGFYARIEIKEQTI